eukprot:CAMPEP_0202457744 /NCGR_PEP_ID=MMETSP1360-20130828/14681_1 /ASSEMBLY_ACC=CAM_ASM_000848 /TAXON_ID=515479 /ORGANISM="Licmophora paradoxa, Strain CCMP2313" /LENGTH=33 /DNA_ID= /DNA_START= /DNA_END= /DNA_ORIENTATION=
MTSILTSMGGITVSASISMVDRDSDKSCTNPRK